jgi:hypothetical protein
MNGMTKKIGVLVKRPRAPHRIGDVRFLDLSYASERVRFFTSRLEIVS